MTERHPHVLLKCAMSLDGYLDDATDERLLLSSPEDFAHVDAERATVDAILVGATTIRKDNPRLMIRSPALRAQRLAGGLPETPIKVSITATGDLDGALPFFTAGDCEKIVYTSPGAFDQAQARLSNVATIVAFSGLPELLSDLHDRGVRRLMVEGGNTVHTQFLLAGLVDELQISVAPFFVGDPTAPRFVGAGPFPFDKDHRLTLSSVSQHGDCALLRYRRAPL
jgi:5-amino-6-(5-phosphoribosylamino)uracil reductase